MFYPSRGNKHEVLIIHIMMDINERQDQTFTSRSNIYVFGNTHNGRDLYLLGVNALVQFKRGKNE